MNDRELEMLSLTFPKVPKHAMETLQNYFKHGWEPGSFIVSVLTNDLYGAAARADHINKPAIAFIAEYIINHAPEGSWGTPELVRDWCKRGPHFQRYEKQRLVDILSTP